MLSPKNQIRALEQQNGLMLKKANFVVLLTFSECDSSDGPGNGRNFDWSLSGHSANCPLTSYNVTILASDWSMLVT